jgi:hypothetical protein
VLHQLTQAMLGARIATGSSEAATAPGLAALPSNQQILDASKKAYSQYQSAADALTLALTNLINTGSQQAAINAMSAINWASPGISDKVADPIFTCPDVQGVIGAARAYPDLNSLSVGVFSNNLPGGGVGVTGFDRNSNLAGSTTTGFTLLPGLLENVLPADPALQLGVWQGAAGTLHDSVIGLEVGVDLGVGVAFGIFLRRDLTFYGFSAGVRVGLGGGATIMSGCTGVFPTR